MNIRDARNPIKRVYLTKLARHYYTTVDLRINNNDLIARDDVLENFAPGLLHAHIYCAPTCTYIVRLNNSPAHHYLFMHGTILKCCCWGTFSIFHGNNFDEGFDQNNVVLSG